MVLVPDTTLDDVVDEDFDMVVLPGGLPGADHLNSDANVQSILKRTAKEDKFTAAICAAPKVLANAGLLQGKKATSYPGCLNPEEVPGLDYLEDPVVQDGRVITSRGPGTAMDFALTLIENLSGKAKRDEVEAALLRP
jgi:4-methyl-5(b-hydroxyethyl)-thiazole monophosphate biosynthesis